MNDFMSYSNRLQETLKSTDWTNVEEFSKILLECWKDKRQVFICGNGGSAGNAGHIANDFIYGIAKQYGSGLRVQSLSANTSVITCLANDEGYDKIYSNQLAVQAEKNDVLIVLSGSGNSENILKALETAKDIGMIKIAILGYNGGKAKAMADIPIHFGINDMQISEDLQLVTCHMAMQWLYARKAEVIR